MFNLNKKASRKIIGNIMIYGSIAGATLQALYYANQLTQEKKAHMSTAKFNYNEIHDLYVENEKLRERAIKAEVDLAILKHDMENL